MFSSFATQQAGIVPDGLVSYFDFAESQSYPMTGSLIRDLSVQAGNGTIEGGSSFSNVNGGYLDFNGSNTRINPVGTSTNGPSGTFFNQTSFTIQVWMWFDSLSGDRALCAQGRGNNNEGLHIIARASKLGFNMFNNDLTGAATLTTNRWYNVACTYNRGTGFRKTIYLDGVVDASANGNQYVAPTTDNNFQLGRINWVTGGVPFTGAYLDGRIGQVLIYGRVLSQQDVIQNINASKNRFGLF